jgi:hypothetical protein
VKNDGSTEEPKWVLVKGYLEKMQDAVQLYGLTYETYINPVIASENPRKRPLTSRSIVNPDRYQVLIVGKLKIKLFGVEPDGTPLLFGRNLIKNFLLSEDAEVRGEDQFGVFTRTQENAPSRQITLMYRNPLNLSGGGRIEIKELIMYINDEISIDGFIVGVIASLFSRLVDNGQITGTSILDMADNYSGCVLGHIVPSIDSDMASGYELPEPGNYYGRRH